MKQQIAIWLKFFQKTFPAPALSNPIATVSNTELRSIIRVMAVKYLLLFPCISLRKNMDIKRMKIITTAQ